MSAVLIQKPAAQSAQAVAEIAAVRANVIKINNTYRRLEIRGAFSKEKFLTIVNQYAILKPKGLHA